MDAQKFIESFKNAMEIEGRELSLDDKFREYPEWSSLAFLSVLAMIDDEYDIVIEGKNFKEMETLRDIFDAVEKAKN